MTQRPKSASTLTIQPKAASSHPTKPRSLAGALCAFWHGTITNGASRRAWPTWPAQWVAYNNNCILRAKGVCTLARPALACRNDQHHRHLARHLYHRLFRFGSLRVPPRHYDVNLAFTYRDDRKNGVLEVTHHIVLPPITLTFAHKSQC